MIRTIGGTRGVADTGGYRFSGRTLSAKSLSRGLYSTPIGFYLLIEPVVDPSDVRGSKLLMEDGAGLLLE